MLMGPIDEIITQLPKRVNKNEVHYENLEPGTRYDFYVSSFRAKGEIKSRDSPVASIHTSMKTSIPRVKNIIIICYILVPMHVLNLTAEVYMPGVITISFEKPTGKVDNYTVNLHVEDYTETQTIVVRTINTYTIEYRISFNSINICILVGQR